MPDFVVSAGTTNTFKNRLDKFWSDQDIMGDFTFWISLSLSLSLRPNFRLRPHLIQKVK